MFTMILCVATIILGIVFFLWLVRQPAPDAAQKIRPAEEILTLQMNPSLLLNALDTRASDWCTAKRTLPIFGDIVLSSTEEGEATFNEVMLTDSMAPLMARDYPHLFQYEEEDGRKTFTMSSSANAVSVPVWLVKALVLRHVLQLPKDEENNQIFDMEI